jgi:hypothetical protein
MKVQEHAHAGNDKSRWLPFFSKVPSFYQKKNSILLFFFIYFLCRFEKRMTDVLA